MPRWPWRKNSQPKNYAEISIYALIWDMTRNSQLLIVFMALLAIPLSIAPLELQKRIIDLGIIVKNVELTAILLAVYVVVAGLQALLFYLLHMQEGRIQEVVARRIRQRVLKLIRRKQKNEFSDIRPGTVMTVYALEVDPIGEFAGQSFSVPVVDGGVFLAMLVYMIYTEPLLAAVALAFFVPQIILVPIVQYKINNRTSKRIKLVRRAGEETLGLLDGKEGFRFPFVAAATRAVYVLRMQTYRLKYAMKYVVLFLIYMSRIAVLGVGGYMVMHDQTGIGVVVAFLVGLDRLTDRWNELVSFFRSLQDARLKHDLVFDILDPNKSVERSG